MSLALYRMFPANAFSRFMGWLAGRRWPGPILRPVIRLYVAVYRIEMAEYVQPVEAYPTFNAFFSRPFKAGARPVDSDPARVVSPVEGTVSRAGIAGGGRLIQAKGLEYTLEELLAGDPSWRGYAGGAYVTIYLSPRNYHRIHSPAAGNVTRFRYEPGRLITVSPRAVGRVQGLFSRNERIVSFLSTPFGEMALVAVGAAVVGKIRVVYHPVASNIRKARPLAETLPEPFPIDRGAELGRFELGSTVICLFRPGEVTLDALQPGDPLRLGQGIGTVAR